MGCKSSLDCALELRVDIGLREVGFFDDCCFTVASFRGLRRRECIGLVGTFGTPGNIVPVAVSVHVEDVDVAAGNEEVLRRM